MKELSIEMVRFPQGEAARLIQAGAETPAGAILAALEIFPPRGLVILNGGTAKLEPGLEMQLARLIQDGLARLAAEERLTLLTGGTQAGIFQLLGQGFARWGRTAPVIGVAVAGLCAWPGKPADKPDGEAPLEPHHSHFVLVKGQEWGDETQTMYDLAAELSAGCPSIAVFAGGGEIARREMEANLRQGREMILLAGSGRSTDAVLQALDGQAGGDERAAAIAQQGKITPFPIDRPPHELGELIRHKLFGRGKI